MVVKFDLNIGLLLTLLLICLKMGHIIDWSWWWIFSPLLIPIILVLFVSILIMVLKIIFGKW